MSKSRAKAAVKAKERAKEVERERALLLAEEQESELDALSAIYDTWFSRLEPEETDFSYPRGCRVRVVPHPGELPSSNRSFVDVVVKCSREYPGTSPLISIENASGISDDEAKELERSLKEIAVNKLGSPLIFDLLTFAQEFLVPRNRARVSVYEEMIQERKQGKLRAELEQKRKEEIEKLKLQAQEVASKREQDVLQIDHEKEVKMRLEWLQSRGMDVKVPDISNVSRACTSQSLLILSHLLRKLVSALGQDHSALQTLFNCWVASGILPPEALYVLDLPDSDLASKICDLTSTLEKPSSEFLAMLNCRIWLPEYTPSSSFIQSGAHLLSLSETKSRYKKDFIELEVLGKGSFGVVTKVQNRLDGRFYAIKRISIGQRLGALKRIFREVVTLSQLHHPYVLRYYQAWIEQGMEGKEDTSTVDLDFGSRSRYSGSKSGGSLLHSDSVFAEEDDFANSFSLEAGIDATGVGPVDQTDDTDSRGNASEFSKYYVLYIQTEYCAKTLREMMDCNVLSMNPREIWSRFRQILEGLIHIHASGIIHRDLKPSNIFADPGGDVRIGDLGLATFGTTRVGTMSTSLFEHSSSEDASSGVGTRLYMSPEQENPALAAGLTDKCDMYALGIVFFEMWFPFSTGHERIDVLTKLRSKLAFPEGFERSHPRQVRIIRWLLSPEASKRPSAFELLHHNLLPPKLEDEQFRDALRALANPHATFYRQLLDHLFLTSLKSQKRSELVTSERIHLPTALNFVSMEIQNIFEVHFANAIKTPTLITATKSGEAMPEKEELEEDSGVDFGDMIGDHEADMVLMNRKGTLFKLRFSLRESLDVLKTRKGRYQSVRTYEIGPVFRQSPVAGDPREYFQADFDIPFASPLSFAECIVVLEDVLNQIGVSKRADYSNVIRIGHHIVTRGIFEFCGINDNDSRKAILRLINDPNVTRSALQSLMLNSKTCDQLLALRDHRSGNIRESVCFLREFLARNPTTFSALEEVLKFIEFYEALGRNTTSLAFDPFLQLEEVYSGLVFRCLLASRQCIAIGGNYLLPLSQGEGCGISISLAAVAEFTPPNEASSFDSSTRVYVGSFGENMILERLRLVGELWKEGVCAGFSIDEDLNSSEQQTEAAVNGAQWLVTIREKSLPAPPVRIRNIEKKTDTEIPRSEVSKFFARPSRRR